MKYTLAIAIILSSCLASASHAAKTITYKSDTKKPTVLYLFSGGKECARHIKAVIKIKGKVRSQLSLLNDIRVKVGPKKIQYCKHEGTKNLKGKTPEGQQDSLDIDNKYEVVGFKVAKGREGKYGAYCDKGKRPGSNFILSTHKLLGRGTGFDCKPGK